MASPSESALIKIRNCQNTYKLDLSLFIDKFTFKFFFYIHLLENINIDMEIKEITLTLKSGEKIFAWYAQPTRAPRAIICLCHGWGEHSLRYKDWAQRFIDQEYAFFSWDHIGHGQSDGKRGHVKNYNVFMEEINLVLNKVSQINPSVPVVLYGHSMGGNLVINFAIRENSPFTLLIATSPWIKLTKKNPPILNLAVKVLNRVAPALQFKAPLDSKGICQVAEVVSGYKKDPLNHGKITPRLVTVMDEAGEYALANIERLNRPFLLIHGDADPVASFDASSELHAKSKTCSFIPFKDMYHELHNEPIKDDLFNIIKEWLSGNLSE